jgi:hypothetical protein
MSKLPPRVARGPRKLRHGARSVGQECIRDGEMRDALREGRWSIEKAPGYHDKQAQMRAAARAELRAQWAAEDAARAAEETERTKVLAAAGLTRMAPPRER